jgi:putative Mg2+ transporter-C (MgtC) family protein
MILEQIISNPVNIPLLVSALLGAVFGLERELAGKDPSLRTFTLISMGSCVFSLISVASAEGVVGAEPSRIAAQIIPGIGFLGAGTIYRSSQKVAGLTTAALMWVAAAVGMAVGFHRMDIAISATFIALLMVYGLKGVHAIVFYLRGAPKGALDRHGNIKSNVE